MPLFRDGDCPPLRRWSEPAQIAGFAACALFINFLIGFLISPFGFTDSVEFKEEIIVSFGVIGGLLLVSVVGPFMETVYGQWLPLVVGRWAKWPPVNRILLASSWFAVLHIGNGPAHVFQAFGMGWVFASCFLFCRKESWLKALRVTSLAHALNNAVVLVLFLVMTMGPEPNNPPGERIQTVSAESLRHSDDSAGQRTAILFERQGFFYKIPDRLPDYPVHNGTVARRDSLRKFRPIKNEDFRL